MPWLARRSIDAIRNLIDRAGDSQPVLVSAHAYEREGVNAIPAALSKLLSERLGMPFDTNVVQTNVVGHTGADSYSRLARQAAFGGEIERGRKYLMVDDFIEQGGTLANLRGWVEKRGLTAHSVFDPRIVVLAIQGRRVTLPTTLKLTAALRGLLMRECRLQPPPEWFSGHRHDGKPTVSPHMALAPLPFVGAPHADGRIMGMALILPARAEP